MVPFTISERIRQAMAPHHRQVQAALAVLANRRLGLETPPRGIGKFQGGIRVGEREIFIGPNAVADDWRRYNLDPSPEEEAAAWAVTEVARLFSRGGVQALREFGGIESLAE